MALTATVLATLASHWRRKPLQFAALVAGLAVATALWSGVQALNAQARDSYAEAAAVLGGDRLASLVAAGGKVTLADYVALRRAGWRVSPVIEGRWRTGNQSFRLIGFDALTLPPAALGGAPFETAAALGSFLTPPFGLLAAPATAAALRDAGAEPEIRETDGLPPGVVLTDIALAAEVLGRADTIDRLILAPSQPPGLAPVAALTGGRISERPPDPEGAELARLTDSFHLNLTAFGLLSFVVGLFIVHATVGLAFEQRRAMVRTLRALGVSKRRLTVAMLLELALVALLAGMLGMMLGYVMAAALLPDVAASLSGLYGAMVPGTLNLRPGWWLAGLGMALGGTGLAAATSLWKLNRLPVLAAAQAEAWHGAQIRLLRVQGALALSLVAVALLVGTLGNGLVAGFVLMAAVLMAAALALPGCLALALGLARRTAKGPVLQWFLAESRAQIGGLSLALMALLLALAVNIGVGTMVESFRGTFLAYLDQRLAAEIYVRGSDPAQAAEMEAFLSARDDVIAVLPVQDTEVEIGGWPVFLYGIRDDPMYRQNWPLLEARADAWDRVADGTGILISEQMARKLELDLGDRVSPGGLGEAWTPEVVGIYPDYGNPTGQALTSNDQLLARWPATPLTRFAVRLMPGAEGRVLAALDARFALGPDQAVDQAGLKHFSREVFERTFAVTLALNVLTFAVAGLALLTSLVTLAEMRLPQLAPLWGLGLTRAELGRLEFLRSLFLALLTAVLAVPLGLLVAWILLAVVNVEAFGWRIPQAHFPGDWIRLVAMAVAVAGLAAILPARRLRHTPPALLLRIFSDER